MFTLKKAGTAFFVILLSFGIFEMTIAEEPEKIGNGGEFKNVSWVCDVPKNIIVKTIADMTERKINEEFSCGCVRRGKDWYDPNGNYFFI